MKLLANCMTAPSHLTAFGHALPLLKAGGPLLAAVVIRQRGCLLVDSGIGFVAAAEFIDPGRPHHWREYFNPGSSAVHGR